MLEQRTLAQIGDETVEGIAFAAALLPMTAVPASIPSASNAAAMRLPLASVTSLGASTR